jgi:hypothetical protein
MLTRSILSDNEHFSTIIPLLCLTGMREAGEDPTVVTVRPCGRRLLCAKPGDHPVVFALSSSPMPHSCQLMLRRQSIRVILCQCLLFDLDHLLVIGGCTMYCAEDFNSLAKEILQQGKVFTTRCSILGHRLLKTKSRRQTSYEK